MTAQEDHAGQLRDPELLDRATALARVLFSQDTDLLREAARRQRCGEAFAGVIFAEQLAMTVGQCLQELELIAVVYDPKDIADRVEYLPLR